MPNYVVVKTTNTTQRFKITADNADAALASVQAGQGTPGDSAQSNQTFNVQLDNTLPKSPAYPAETAPASSA